MVGWQCTQKIIAVMIGTAGRRDVRKADKPFCFTGSSELREILGKEADDEKRLVELLEEVPLDSISYNTHTFFCGIVTSNRCIQMTLPNGWRWKSVIMYSESGLQSSTPSNYKG